MENRSNYKRTEIGDYDDRRDFGGGGTVLYQGYGEF